MDIMLHTDQEGHIALTCDGVFNAPVEAIELEESSLLLGVRFTGVSDPVMMNCAVDPAIADALSSQTVCAIGFFLGRELAGAIHVPFRILAAPCKRRTMP